MKHEILFTMKMPYRQDFVLEGFRFGEGEKTCAVVGSMRGDEIQQMYACACLVRALTEIEERGNLLPGHEILVIPCANTFSMNVGKRFWPMDNTDINRMFPGYDLGETTQRIAAGLFEAVKGYRCGVHLTSFYLPGKFVPHARIINTGYQSPTLGSLFGVPYIVTRDPKPFDTTTLNYNWQIWDSCAFNLYTQSTSQLDEKEAMNTVDAVLRYLSRTGAVKYYCYSGYLSTVIKEEDLINVLMPTGGIFKALKSPGAEVQNGELLGVLLDPFTAKIIQELHAPNDGMVFFAMEKPLVLEHEIAFKLLPRRSNS